MRRAELTLIVTRDGAQYYCGVPLLYSASKVDPEFPTVASLAQSEETLLERKRRGMTINVAVKDANKHLHHSQEYPVLQ